jgi:hypothetical protein
MNAALVLALALLLPTAVQASDWRSYDDEHKCEYDSDSVRKDENGWTVVWTRCARGNTFDTILWQQACRDRKARMLSINGRSPSHSEWLYPQPDSPGDTLRFLTC